MIEVKGKNVNLYVLRGASYVPAICSTNISRSASTGTLTTLVRGAGASRRFVPTIDEETITLEGLRTMDTPTSWQIHEFVIKQFYTVRIIYDDLNGHTMQLDGDVLLTAINDNNGASDFSTWSITMVRNDQWAMSGTVTDDSTPPIVVAARANGVNKVRVEFDEYTLVTPVGWTVYISDTSTTLTITSVEMRFGNVWYFTTSGPMAPGQTLFLNYDNPTGNTTDLALNEMVTLINFPIENVIISTGTFTGYFGYSGSIAFPITALDALTPQFSGVFTSGGPMTFGTSTVPSNVWMYFKEPDTEPVKTSWYNTAFNNGTFPDSVFKAPQVVSGFRYYVSRNRMSLDNTQPITAS